ncbi:aminotransferase-like domain-containing protein [Clostridium hydrogenum]|uniref:aminotransferase-like domain-containing protein n=1 Tax=Clostridium hydrogenum TaxID=2855764 RepID=UPI001F3872A6|nr:PLP-dependent aminotransferase family protein [Clostridium hydrogenum]
MNYAYTQIIEAIKSDIETRLYKPGKKLPSVRELSKKYNCSTNTAARAYEHLKNSHLIYSIPQSGYYLVENSIKNTETNNEYINFSSGNPIIGNMNTPDLKHCLDRAVDIYKNNSLSNTYSGVKSLKEILPKYLSSFQVFTHLDNIFVNLGIQQALSILTYMNFPNCKDTILIEQPCYRFYVEFLKLYNVKTIGIERNENGIDLNELEHIFKTEKIKFFYTIPRNHNPLGTSYNKTQRLTIAKLAAKYDVYIVEDDYFGDISFDSKFDPIYSYGDYKHIIYLKSFSKILPWMRIGITVIPTELLDIFKDQIRVSFFNSYFSASLISQATLEIYLRSNILKKHTTSIAKDLSEKQKCLRKNLSKLKDYNLSYMGGKSGVYSYISLPNTINADKLAINLRKRKVLVSSGKNFFINDNANRNGIRLSIACTDKNAINLGFKILFSELKNYR